MTTTLTTLHVKAMTLPFSIKLVTPATAPLTASQVTTFQTQFQTYLDYVDAVFSPFHDSLVTRYQHGTLTADVFTPEFQEVYALCVKAQTLTSNAFDPFFTGHYDPTGLVKGWAIQQAFTRFLQPVLDTGMLSAAAINGAGDIQTGVASGSSYLWHIGIEDPTNPQRTLCQYSLQNGAVATSGTSQRGEHIHRQTVSDLQQASVLAPSLVTADILATAAIAMGPTAFFAFAHTHHVSGLLVTGDHHHYQLEGGLAHAQ